MPTLFRLWPVETSLSWPLSPFDVTQGLKALIVLGTPLAAQWLRLCISNAGGMSSIPGWGTKIPHAAWCSQKKKKKKKSS